MNSTLSTTPIATAQNNCELESTTDEQELAQLELDKHLEIQSEQISQQDTVTTRLQESNRARVALALADGKLYALQKRQLGKRFTTWLKNNGLVRKIASMYVRLYQFYQYFSLEQIGLVDVKTLVSLTAPRYKLLLGKLKYYQQWTQALVENLMQQEQHKQKVLKSDQSDRTLDDDSGWRRMPSGGRRYYSLNLHDESTAIAIERYAKSENVRREQIIKAAITIFEQYKKKYTSPETWQHNGGNITASTKHDTDQTLLGFA